MITILKPTKKNGKKTFFPLKLALKHCLLILLLVNFSPLAAVSIAQPMSIKLKNSNLIELFEVIENNSSYKVVYKEYMKNKKVSANYESEEVETILNETLASVGLTYRIRGRQIVITEAVSPSVTQQDNRITVEGIVVDQNGESLIGVTIVDLSNEKNMSVTDIEGKFSMKVKPGSKLRFSYVGYMAIDQEVSTSMRVVMKENTEVLDEVVVVGFGKQKKESVTGAISTISAKDLRVPASSLSNAFAGRIAGMVSVQRSGEPGADGSDFWIRGISTFSGATKPLIYIDGVEVSSADMNALAPEVIENFSVLKDASATALYGARGANGVILITTRSGQKNERFQINARVEGKLAQPVKMVDLADGVTYMEMFNEARLARGGDIHFSQEKIDNTRAGANPYIFPNVDWQEFLFKDWSFNQTVNLNVTGGADRISYFMNANFKNDDGILKKEPTGKYNNNIRQQEYSFQGNIAADLTPTTTASLRISSRIVERSGSRIDASTIYQELFESPSVLFPAYFPNTIEADHTLFGNASGGPHPQHGANLYHNVYAEMTRGYRNVSENTNTVTFDVNQKLDFITEGLNVKGLASFKNWSTTNYIREFTPVFYEIGDHKNYWQNADGTWDYKLANPLNNGTNALDIKEGYSNTGYTKGDRFINLQLSLDYAHKFNEKHDVTAMLVYMQRDNNINNPKVASVVSTYYNTLATRNQGIAGRMTYSFDNRYMAEFNFGYNGSENFEDGKRFGFFPSFSVGYNIANEAYWKSLAQAIPIFKIRGSWGIVGNANTDGRFPYLTFVNLTGKSFNFGSPSSTQNGLSGGVITRYGALGAQWENGHKLNLGLDINVMNALSINLDLYKETRDRIFMQYNTIPVESGISGDLRPYANLGKVENKGVDLSVTYDKTFLNNELYVSFRGNLTYAKNKLLERDEPEMPFAYMSEIGKPLNVHWGLKSLGLFKDEEEIKASPTQTFSSVMPGDIKYADLNNDGQIDGNDVTKIGNPTTPQLVYGFGVSAQYKGFDASFFLQGAAKTSIMMGDIHPFNGQFSQLYQFIADDYWSESNPNPNAAYPRLVTGQTPAKHNNHQVSDYWMRDGSFIRLKNVEIGYTHKFARIYLSGQNLLTFSDFDHWDPEMGGMNSAAKGSTSGFNTAQGRGLKYPTLRTFSLGVQLTF